MRRLLVILTAVAFAACEGSIDGPGTNLGSGGSGAGGSGGSGTGGSGGSGTGGSGGGAGVGGVGGAGGSGGVGGTGGTAGSGTGGSGGTGGAGGTGGSAGAGTGGSGGTSGTGGSGGGTSGGPTIAGCPVFPADNAWNTDISNAPVDPNSANYINSMGAGTGMHPDFGTNPNYGIPFIVVPGTQPKVPITFRYADESDPGPYPIPDNAPIEGGAGSTGDRHILVIDSGACYLYEVWASAGGPGNWSGGSGAIWHLNVDWTRPAGWTSADAAGLPVFPGLVRYDEVAAGAINHALRFTVNNTQHGYVAPASHFASSNTDPNTPPMGLRVRLKASVNISGYPASVQVILTALKRYGMIVADNGSDWYISGASDSRFNDDELRTIGNIHGSDFEVIQHGPIVTQ
jgi:hypothetical protein